MRRILSILPVLLTLSVAFAQGPEGHSRSAAEADGFSMADVLNKQVEKEIELDQLLDRYKAARNPTREALKARMMNVIYDLFDLSMMVKASEANNLRLSLKSLSTRSDYAQNPEIRKLENQLKLVEKQIQQRLNLRDEIVAKRLYDMIH